MEVTHPDRVVFPEDAITKGDVVAHYESVAERLLPFVAGRDLTVQRFPKGIAEPGFMQKNAPDHYPKGLIRRHRVGKGDGGTTVYPVIDSEEAIAYFANLGVITFHAPTVRVADRTHPDWAIWDLDPPPGEVALVRHAADTMHSFLDSLGIPTVLLASGSNGYHLRVRLDGSMTATAVERMARGAAVLAATEHEELFTVAFRKADRNSRVFVDWMRNNPMATSVAPWSLRPRRGAPVAAPLAWNELPSVDPQGVTLRTVATRLRSDPWSGATAVDLSTAAKAVAGALDERGIKLKPFDRFRS